MSQLTRYIMGAFGASIFLYQLGHSESAAQTLVPTKPNASPPGEMSDALPAQPMPEILKSALDAVKAQAKAQTKAAAKDHLQPSGDPRCALIAGTWRGLGREHLILDADGTAHSKTALGTWSCIDPAARKFLIDAPGIGRLDLVLDSAGERANVHDASKRLMVAYKDHAAFKKLNDTAPVPTPSLSTPCNGVIGHWLWTDGAKVTMGADGVAISDRGQSGRWTCADAKQSRITLIFPDQPEMNLVLNEKNRRLEGKDKAGWPISVGRP